MIEEIRLKCPHCGSDKFNRDPAHKWAAREIVKLFATGDGIKDIVIYDSGYKQKYVYSCYVCNAVINPLEDLI